MDIRVLRYFLQIATDLNISRASNSLHITQPTLSRQMQDLEDEIGKKLFIRSNRNLTLTASGRILKARAEEILSLVAHTKNELKYEESVNGDVYIGAGESINNHLFTNLLKDLHDEYPQIRFRINSGNATEILDKIDSSLYDFGVIFSSFNTERYASLAVDVADTWGVLMLKDHPLCNKKYIQLQDLMAESLIVSEELFKNCQFIPTFNNWFANAFEQLKVVATYNLIYNAALLVKNRLGIALTFSDLVNDECLCFRPLRPQLQSQYNIVWRRNKQFSKPALLLLEKLKNKFKSKDDHLS